MKSNAAVHRWWTRALGILMVVPATVLIAIVWPPYGEESTLRESGKAVRATVVSAPEAASDGMNDLSISGTDRITLRIRYEVDGASFEASEPPIDRLAYDGSGSIDVLYDPAAPRVHRIAGAPRSNVAVLALELVVAIVLYLVAATSLVRALVRPNELG